jgi:hypothetical protein
MTWAEVTGGGVGPVATAAQLPGLVVAGAARAGGAHFAAVSLDHGVTWTTFDQGLPIGIYLATVVVDPASSPSQVTLYAGTGAGVYELSFAPQAVRAAAVPPAPRPSDGAGSPCGD